MDLNIELLYFNGCPSWQQGRKNLEVALEQEKLEANLTLIEIKDDEEAANQQFLGSPSFRVNGEELWSEVRSKYNLSCRVYATPGGMRGSPTVEMLQKELRTLNISVRCYEPQNHSKEQHNEPTHQLSQKPINP